MRPLLVIDFQPAYAKCFGSWMTREVLALMRGMSPAEPIVVVSVNEELSGDDATSIQEFWIEQGMDEELRERVTFLEKPYAFFRSWMDQGVEDHEIVAVAQKLRQTGIGDSHELDSEVLAELSQAGADLGHDALFLPWEMERNPCYQRPAWNICGGGRDECLKEVELWLQSCSIEAHRIEHLIY